MKPYAVMFFATSAVSLLYNIPTSAEDDTSARPPAPDYSAIFQSGKVFQDGNEQTRKALTEIAALASQYQVISEKELLAIPGIQVKDGGLSNPQEHTLVHKAEDTATTFVWEAKANRLLSVHVTRSDKSAVAVEFEPSTDPALRGGIESGVVFSPGGRKRMEFIFYENNQPQMLLPIVGEGKRAGVKGTVVAWDESGNKVAEIDITRSQNDLLAIQTLYASLSPAQLDALGVEAGDRPLGRAFQGMDRELKGQIENMVRWSEKIVGIPPENLMKSLVGDALEQEVDGDAISYTVMSRENPAWMIVYDRVSGHLMRADYYSGGGMTLYFDSQREGRLLGGKSAVRKIDRDTTTWLVGFYPGHMAPRIALSTAGDPLDKVLANGTLHVWDCNGVLLVEQEINDARAIEVALSEVEAMLSDTQRAEVGWRGKAEEEKALLGLN